MPKGTLIRRVCVVDSEDATIDLPGINSNNFKASEDTSFLAGDSPATIDCNTGLGENAKNVIIQCDGSGSILVAISHDGITYGDNFTLNIDETLNLNDVSVDSVRITHSGSDSSYRILYQ